MNLKGTRIKYSSSNNHHLARLVMACDSQRSCQLVETRKLAWIIGLVLASVVIVQYIELPYKDNLLSLISGSKACLSSKVGCNEDSPNLKNVTSPLVPKLDEGSVSAENIVSENESRMNHSSELDTIARTISIAPIQNDVQYKSAAENNNTFDISPTEFEIPIAPVSSEIEERVASFLRPLISPSPSVSPKDAKVPAPSPMATLRSTDLPNMSNDSRNSVIFFKNNSGGTSDKLSYVTNRSPPPVKMLDTPVESVVSLSEMYNLLLQSRVSSFSKNPQWSSAADEELLDARSQIEQATIIKDHPNLDPDIYRNLSKFVRSYEIMEQKLKVYVYKDGKKPVSHQPKTKGIYASEGWFMRLMESSNHFVTNNPGEAHLFYLSFSSQKLATCVYKKDSHTFKDIDEYMKNYLEVIKARYTFWNRTEGADHFLVACHDWAPYETRQLMANTIRALCNSDIKEGFVFGKDVSLAETNILNPENPMKETGGMPPSRRKILAFFAGQMHGYVRPILLKQWEDKDPTMKIVGTMKKGYVWHMKNCKYCVCAKGYEVNSPRVVEAILYGCVPVIISDNFVPPFFEILDWNSFAVFVMEKDIPDLKKILESISLRRYVEMYKRVEHVRQHFLWHKTPVKYDIFHMILHSIWNNRVFRLQPR